MVALETLVDGFALMTHDAAIDDSTSPLFSSGWYRLATLRPMLSAGVEINHQRVRGQSWTILSKPAQGKRVRLNSQAWSILGRCNGIVSLQQIFDHLLEQSPEDLAAQGEIENLISKMVTKTVFF